MQMKKTMKSIVMMAVLALAVVGATAQTKWKHVATVESGDEFYLRSDVRRIGTTAVAWTKIVVFADGSVKVAKKQFDCRNERLRILALSNYSAAGHLEFTLPWGYVSGWDNGVTPDTAGEAVFLHACRAVGLHVESLAGDAQ
jgi:hypothetical protein